MCISSKLYDFQRFTIFNFHSIVRLIEKPKSMKPIKPFQVGIAILLFLVFASTLQAQIGINTKLPANGALLDITSSNKGFLLPQVTLTSTSDVTTITPSATIGLLVYNTVTAGSLPFQVTPGFYYWNGSQWLRFYNRGYGLKFDQTNEENADNDPTKYETLDGLDTGNITIPYSGTYQVRVESHYAAGSLVSTSDDGTGQASVRLAMDTNNSGTLTNVEERYVTSTSKRNGSTTINSIPQNITIIYTVDLDVLNTYRFIAQGREWSKTNVITGIFGKDTSGYSGASGVDNAQRGALTLTLVKQQ